MVNNKEGVAIGNVVDNTVTSEIIVSKSMNDFVLDDVSLDYGNHENVVDSGDVNKSVNNLNNDGNNEKHNGNGVDTNRGTYANQLIKDVIEVDNKLSFVPTSISENGTKVVIFFEELLHEGSRKWKLTACDYFVGCKMSEFELDYHLFIMWGKHGLKEIITNGNDDFLLSLVLAVILLK
nr:RNA-directed DNA polymerase, eukaryota, reverse transcriptase zinc-binding domain protein [Tanacetum cinerariifolium]